MNRCSGVLLSLAVVVWSTWSAAAQYRKGDGVALECAFEVPQLGDTPALHWRPFPVCFETDLPLELRYGKDHAMYCGLEIDAALFSWMQAATTVQDCLKCRVAVAPNQQLHLPLCWSIWGAKDAEHLHINNRIDIVLYTDRGLVVGGGVYPVKGHFQFIKEGQVLNLHGVVRWLEMDDSSGDITFDLKDFTLPSSASSTMFSMLNGTNVVVVILCVVFFAGFCYYFTAYKKLTQYKVE